MSPSRRFARFASAIVFLLSAANTVAQTSDCAVPQGNTRSILPQHSANLIGLYTSQDAGYLYGMTQFGFVRAPLSDPANPRPLMLGQHGQKFQNGGVVPMICDCWQMGTTMAFAEAPGGSARVFFDNNSSTQGGGLPGQVGRADGTGAPGFGQQIDLPNYSAGVGIAAIYLPASGKFIGYSRDRPRSTSWTPRRRRGILRRAPRCARSRAFPGAASFASRRHASRSPASRMTSTSSSAPCRTARWRRSASPRSIRPRASRPSARACPRSPSRTPRTSPSSTTASSFFRRRGRAGSRSTSTRPPSSAAPSPA